jgi:hypothetical protein
MNISVFGITTVTLGRHNVKDPRLDQADKLVEAKKKVYVQVDLVAGTEAANADAILTDPDAQADLILQDLEFVETRLSRNPPEQEKAVMEKLKVRLEKAEFLFNAGLDPAEAQLIAPYNLLTNRPVVVAAKTDFADLTPVLIRLLRESGYVSFLTVGGKENRAWLIKKGTTAWAAAGTIHSDLQKGFIRAEVISFEDLINCGGETQAKRAGKMRLETKDYVMRDCDVVNFRFSKPGGG